MKNPLVSIIIPTYNRADYLERAIKSVLNQTYKNLEIIIIDDNSKDNTKIKVLSFNSKKIRYYRNLTNCGAPFSRNRGIDLSKGEYINFLDDDDILFRKKVELQVKKFLESKDKKLGVITSDVEFKYVGINGIKENRKKGYIYRDLLKSYCVYGTESMLIKKKFIVNFDLNLASNHEYDLAIRLARVCNFDFVPNNLSTKFDSKGQITYNFKKKIRGSLYFYRKYKNEFKKFGLKFYLYNYLRIKYLILKYAIGLIIGKNVYKLLK